MNYEEKYNEALKRARANYKADKEMGFLESCDMLELIFPELAESEDERIRKWIASYIHHGVFTEEEHPMALKAVEWLEKQQEQKPEWSEEDEKMKERLITRLNWITHNTRTDGTSPNITFFDEIEWLKSLRPSWKPNDEDEVRLINTSISFLKDFADKGYENAVECIDWLKSKLNGNTGK